MEPVVDDPAHINRPKDTPFRQQRLRACQPILTPFVVITVFVVLGVIMFPLGFIMWHFNNQVVQVEVRYDSLCPDVPIGTLTPVPCTVTMTVPKDIPGPAYFYYKLTNFYQNHRRYVSSRSDLQLSGMPPVTVGGIAECTPLQSVNGSQAPADMYLPCGLVANSFFTDTFSLQEQGSLQNVAWRRDQISWASDRDKKFKNMTQAYMAAHPGISLRVPPGLEGLAAPNQQFNVENEDFIVWMRVAGLPTFRKLYARIPAGLPRGTYNVNIGIKYSTQLFGGSKSVVVTSTSFIGGYNPFLGIAYIVVGGLCLLLAIVFFVVNLVKPRQLGDPSLLSWNKQGTSVN